MIFSPTKYKIIGIIAIVAIVVVGAVVVYAFRKTPSQTVITANSDKLEFNVGNDQTIPINNFVDNAPVIDNGIVVLFDDPASAKFSYNSKIRSFFLTYNELDLATIQTKQKIAESRVISVLGTNSKDVCSLPIQVINEQATLPIYFETCRIINSGVED